MREDWNLWAHVVYTTFLMGLVLGINVGAFGIVAVAVLLGVGE